MKRFANVCNRVASTTKKLEKERIVSEYFQSLNDADLAIAAKFLSGAPFARRDPRGLNTGFAVVRDALLEVNPEWAGTLGPALLRTGDAGDAIAELMGDRSAAGVTLTEAQSYYEKLALST